MLRPLLSLCRLFWRRLLPVGGQERVLACQDVMGQSSEFLDQELEPAVMHLIRTHLDVCASCRTFLDSLENVSRMVRLDPSEPIPEGDAERMMTRLQQAYRETQEEL